MGRGEHKHSRSNPGKQCFIFLSPAVHDLPEPGAEFRNLHTSLHDIRDFRKMLFAFLIGLLAGLSSYI